MHGDTLLSVSLPAHIATLLMHGDTLLSLSLPALPSVPLEEVPISEPCKALPLESMASVPTGFSFPIPEHGTGSGTKKENSLQFAEIASV
jgi:hypothetical protein